MVEIRKRIAELTAEIKEIQDSLPAHSVPPAMLIRLEELEEQLAELREVKEDA